MNRIESPKGKEKRARSLSSRHDCRSHSSSRLHLLLQHLAARPTACARACACARRARTLLLFSPTRHHRGLCHPDGASGAAPFAGGCGDGVLWVTGNFTPADSRRATGCHWCSWLCLRKILPLSPAVEIDQGLHAAPFHNLSLQPDKIDGLNHRYVSFIHDVAWWKDFLRRGNAVEWSGWIEKRRRA